MRRKLGCGYEAPELDARPWLPEGAGSSLGLGGELRDPELRASAMIDTCAGYTARLPEVIETLRARSHWKSGSLQLFCGGEPTEHTLAAIEVLDGSLARLERWQMTDEKDGGGRRSKTT